MDSLFAIQGKDFVLMIADCTTAYSIFKLKEDDDKILILDDNKLFGLVGEKSDQIQFGSYIKANISLQNYKNGYTLKPRETANFIRSELATAIRQGPYQCNCLIAGFDAEEDGPSLYWIDYMGTLQKVTKGAHGYAGYFLYGLLDNKYKPNLTLDETIQIAKQCIADLKVRFLLSQNVFQAKVVDKSGVKSVSLI